VNFFSHIFLIHTKY